MEEMCGELLDGWDESHWGMGSGDKADYQLLEVEMMSDKEINDLLISW